MRKEPKVIEILFDYDQGPLLVKENGAVILGRTGINIVDNDYNIKLWNEKASDLYASCYRRDSTFDWDLYEKLKPKLASYLRKIIARLEENSDGSFVLIINDKEEELLKQFG